MSNLNNKKINIIVCNLLATHEKINLVTFGAGTSQGILILNYYKTFLDEIVYIAARIDYTGDNILNTQFIRFIDVCKLLLVSTPNYREYTEALQSIVYNHKMTNKTLLSGIIPGSCDVIASWTELITFITYTNQVLESTIIPSNAHDSYTECIQKIISELKDIEYKNYPNKYALDKIYYNTIITKFIKINLKLKNDVPKLVHNEYIYKYFLQKINNLATLIDFGYENVENKKTIFSNKYISLSDIYNMLMMTENNFGDFNTFLAYKKIYNMAELVDYDDKIFSWDCLSKIIDCNTHIKCAHERNFMIYIYKMYEDCINDILQEINA